MLNINATYSSLSTDDLVEKIMPTYDIDGVVKCEFWYRGFNDTYKITSQEENYILRIYKKDWRTRAQISFELDALNYLYNRGAKVSYPISRRDGKFITELNAPEGTRYAVLMSFAEGDVLAYKESNDAFLYGERVAELHSLSEGFSSNNDRFKLDDTHLIIEPLKAIEQFLKERPDDWNYINTLCNKSLENINEIPSDTVDYGFCHGDLHGWNAHKSAGDLIFFDFDCCGFGNRAYEISVFRWSILLNKGRGNRDFWEQYLKGYTSKRTLSDSDLELTADYMIIRDIWRMGLQIFDTFSSGKGSLGDQYIGERINFLQTVEKRWF